jgi:vacuolar-type H+-ATPase subunit H
MEKLEEILHAEERARHAVADARVRAREMRIEAAAEAELIMTAAQREAAEEAATIAATIMRQADAEAARIAADSENELAEFLRATEVRIERAVRAALEDLGR